MLKNKPLPIIGISCCTQSLAIPKFGDVTYHVVYKKYLEAVIEAMECIPVFIPVLGSTGKSDRLTVVDGFLDILDGIVLTGAVANVNPARYGVEYREEHGTLDVDRDEMMISLAKGAVERGIPIFGICRGMQELNVAFGGSLLARVHEEDSRFDHRSNPEDDFEDKYKPSHEIVIEKNGVLSEIIFENDNVAQDIFVNSLHSQGIDRVGDGIKVEARALDGTIEAITALEAKSFCLGVQWHPEWWVESNPLNKAIYDSFSIACSKYKNEKGVL